MTTTQPRRPVRIANCSGFYGDTLSAARQMVEGGPIDVLTGDYLAELTMLILHKARNRSGVGYAKTFLTQLEQVLETCLDKNIKIVANAGGLAPGDLAEEIRRVGDRLGRSPKVAYVTGDDLTERIGELQSKGARFAHLDTDAPMSDRGDDPVTANAYLGGWGIAEALAAGADVVVTGRVTDASLVVGPAAWWHNWQRTDFDQLAGAVAAGHVIECGPQACGGNYPFLDEITDQRYPGFPIAEVAANGDSIITKHPGTGGVVSTGTVTAQLLYEIGAPAYEGPDVVAHFDALTLTQEGEDRVLISGSRGSAPRLSLKVAMNFDGGFRNTMTMVITGLDIEAKANWARRQMFELLGGEQQFESVDISLLRFDHDDAATNAEATAHLRISVKDRDERKVGRAFSNVATAMAVGSYPGLHTTTPPTPATAYGVYWPTLVDRDVVEHVAVTHDGTRIVVPHSPGGPAPDRSESVGSGGDLVVDSPTTRLPLGRIAGARSGDKGGNANVGVWTRTDAEFEWLRNWLDTTRFRELIPEAKDLAVRRYELASLRSLNFVIVKLLGEGVASSTRPDPQAKGLGEYIRSRLVDVPVALVDPR
jgi:hypothetical protein